MTIKRKTLQNDIFSLCCNKIMNVMETKDNEYFDDILKHDDEEPKPHIYDNYTEPEVVVDEDGIEEINEPKVHLCCTPIQDLVSLAKMCEMLKSYYNNLSSIYRSPQQHNQYMDSKKSEEMKDLMIKYKKVSDFEEKVIEEMQRRIGDYEID